MLYTIQLRSTLLLIIVFFFCVPLHAFVVPRPTRGTHPVQHSSSEQESAYKLRNVFPQLTWIRDRTIEKVFGLVSKTRGSAITEPQRESIGELPNKLRARYGGDVVLRFNITTSKEESALAEAASTLFLDVWEFTNNWADIRLREEDVSLRRR